VLLIPQNALSLSVFMFEKIKKAASPNASTSVCTVSDFEYLIQNRALPLGMLYVSLCMDILLTILNTTFKMYYSDLEC
jgi:hypothetical protein